MSYGAVVMLHDDSFWGEVFFVTIYYYITNSPQVRILKLSLILLILSCSAGQFVSDAYDTT